MTGRPAAVMRTPGTPSMSAGWASASRRAPVVARPATSPAPRTTTVFSGPRARSSELGFGSKHGKQPREVALAGRCQERVDDLPGRRVRGRRRRAQADPSAGPAGQHLRSRSAPAEDRGDRAERDLERVVEHERDPFCRVRASMTTYSARPTESASRASSSGSIREAPAASRGSMPTLISSGCSARTPRLRSTSRQIRPVTVVSQPRRSSMPPPPVRASRSHASWTAFVGVGVRAERAERDRVEIGALGLELRGELFLFGHGSPWRTAMSLPGRIAGR